MATLDRRGQGIQNKRDNNRGEKGIPMLPELSPNVVFEKWKKVNF